MGCAEFAKTGQRVTPKLRASSETADGRPVCGGLDLVQVGYPRPPGQFWANCGPERRAADAASNEKSNATVDTAADLK